MAWSGKSDGTLHSQAVTVFKRVVDMLQLVISSLVRSMAPENVQIPWGHHSAELCNVARGAQESILSLIAPIPDVPRKR